MKYRITRVKIVDTDYSEYAEQYKSVGFAIQAYEQYKNTYKDLPCSESFITKDKIVFKAQDETMTIKIYFEVIPD